MALAIALACEVAPDLQAIEVVGIKALLGQRFIEACGRRSAVAAADQPGLVVLQLRLQKGLIALQQGGQQDVVACGAQVEQRSQGAAGAAEAEPLDRLVEVAEQLLIPPTQGGDGLPGVRCELRSQANSSAIELQAADKLLDRLISAPAGWQSQQAFDALAIRAQQGNALVAGGDPLLQQWIALQVAGLFLGGIEGIFELAAAGGQQHQLIVDQR